MPWVDRSWLTHVALDELPLRLQVATEEVADEPAVDAVVGFARRQLGAVGHVAPHEPPAVRRAHDARPARVEPAHVRPDRTAQPARVVVEGRVILAGRVVERVQASLWHDGLGFDSVGREDERHAVAPAPHQLGRDDLGVRRRRLAPVAQELLEARDVLVEDAERAVGRVVDQRAAAGRRRSCRRTSSGSRSRAARRRSAPRAACPARWLQGSRRSRAARCRRGSRSARGSGRPGWAAPGRRGGSAR